VPDLPLFRANKIAKQILADLSSAGIPPDPSHDCGLFYGLPAACPGRMASASRLEVLMVLIEAGGLLVSKHELLSHVWPGQGKLQGELNFGIEALKPLWHQGLPPFNRILGFL
jgi:hypothetical protein